MIRGIRQYFLFHTLTSETITNLNWAQTKTLAKNLGAGNIRNWLVYTEQSQSWLPLIDLVFEVDGNSFERSHFELPAVPDQIKGSQSQPTTFIEVPEDRREAPRFSRTFTLMLDIDGNLVQASTDNISTSGLKITEPVTLKSSPKYVMGIAKIDNLILDMKLAPIYKGGSKETDSFQCVAVSDMAIWEASQKEV